MCAENLEQERLASLPIGNVLVLAPAGCGKTQALAQRAKAVLGRGECAQPHMILALTFSNKAKENIASRMREVVGARWRERIVVTNFHGLSGRIVRAHGRSIGLPQDIIFPDEPWRRRLRNELGINYRNTEVFETTLRSAKSGAFDDSEVMSRLISTGNDQSVAYELRLRAERTLDYDDLIRHAARILRNANVSHLYQQHFAMVMVDEVQDLTHTQLDLVRGVGGERVTYVGDPAQGIYSFAGADPEGVIGRIRGFGPDIVEFNTSYRSTRSVLDAVNALAREMGSTELTCGCPEKWPDAGHAIYIERGTTDEESIALTHVAEGIFRDNVAASIGVIARSGRRMTQLKKAAAQGGLEFEDWSLATHIPQIVELFHRHLREAVALASSQLEVLAELELLCRADLDPADSATLDDLASACDELRTLVTNGTTVSDSVARCRTSVAPGAPVAPGLHFLTGHRGKGQEFDWVVVLGLEDGHVPDFRKKEDPEELRVLHVMASRARYGLIFSYSRHTQSKGVWYTSTPSRWLPLLRSAATESDVL